jgi:SAM-dependent methyltransferase
MNEPQGAAQRYLAIVQYHGLVNGIRRVWDQMFQIDLYDRIHATNTGQILSGETYAATAGLPDAAAFMHYQPTYTAAVRDPLRYLAKHFPVIGACSAGFLDLGCGRGKSLHVARGTLLHLNLVGVDVHPQLLRDAAFNLGVIGKTTDTPEPFAGCSCLDQKVELRCANVLDVDYAALLAKFDVVLVFNKNSFDKATTARTLELIRAATVGKDVFYIYNNPVF